VSILHIFYLLCIEIYHSRTDSNAPRTNKRFLTSIIRSTDDHNKTVLRAQALAAQEVKMAREAQERKERRARAEEAVEAERMRRLMNSGRSSESESWKKGRDRDRRKKRKIRSWEGGSDDYIDDYEPDGRCRERHRRHSPSPSRRRHSRREEDKRHEAHRHSRRKARSRSRSPSDSEPRNHRRHRSRDHSPKSRHRRSRSRSHTDTSQPRKRSRLQVPADDRGEEGYSRPRSPARSTHSDVADREADLRRRLKAKQKRHDTASSSPRRSSPVQERDLTPRKVDHSPSHTASTMSLSRSPTPGPSLESHSQLPSKMDKYFEESYDPRLDVAPLTVPKVPAEGLIDNSEFQGWDAMLELLRFRREDKEEKKRMERLGLTKEKFSKK
jgi:hypothetical protein